MKKMKLSPKMRIACIVLAIVLVVGLVTALLSVLMRNDGGQQVTVRMPGYMIMPEATIAEVAGTNSWVTQSIYREFSIGDLNAEITVTGDKTGYSGTYIKGDEINGNKGASIRLYATDSGRLRLDSTSDKFKIVGLCIKFSVDQGALTCVTGDVSIQITSGEFFLYGESSYLTASTGKVFITSISALLAY